MTAAKKPSASDFLSAASNSAVHDKAQVLRTRRLVLEELLAHPLPANPVGRDTNTIYQRMRARVTLGLGDILDVLSALPAHQGRKFAITSEINAYYNDSKKVWSCSGSIHGVYQSAAEKRARSKTSHRTTYPSFRISIAFDLDQITGYTLHDYSRDVIVDGQLSSPRTDSADLAVIRRALGEAIGSIAPERLDDIAAAMQANPHPLDAPVATSAPATLQAPKLPFKK